MLKWRSTRIVAWIAALTACLAQATTGQVAAQASRTEKYFGDWSVLCLEDAAGAKQCNMIQARLRGNPSRVIFRWVVAQDKDKQLLSVLQTPPGVVLPEGVLATPEGEGAATKLNYRVCGAQWCEARLVFDATWEKHLAEKPVNIRYLNGRREAVTTQITSNGFGEALKYFKSQLN